MDKKIFGTDGIRNIYGKYPLDPENLSRLVQSIVQKLYDNKKLKIIVGRDTRDSGKEIESIILKSFQDLDIELISLGIVPTPVVAFLTKKLNADLGLVISASHNSSIYNGFKFFNSKGYKFPEKTELEIEEIFFSKRLLDCKGNFEFNERFDLQDEYVKFVKSLSQDLSGLKIVLDCANGAAFNLAPRIFSELGAEIINIASVPDGKNINHFCGSLYPENIQKKVLEHGADIGIAFDGDADRVILCDEKGNIIDGDKILALIANNLNKKNQLNNSTIVTTVMSNIGLFKHLNKLGIKSSIVNVGDQNVIHEMYSKGYSLGGEKSGHIIISPYSTTGDGIFSAVQVLNIMKQDNMPLSSLTQIIKLFPQVLINVDVNAKIPLNNIPGLSSMKENMENNLDGRIFIRYSGTENKLRIMVEGSDKNQIENYALQLASFVKNTI